MEDIHKNHYKIDWAIWKTLIIDPHYMQAHTVPWYKNLVKRKDEKTKKSHPTLCGLQDRKITVGKQLTIEDLRKTLSSFTLGFFVFNICIAFSIVSVQKWQMNWGTSLLWIDLSSQQEMGVSLVHQHVTEALDST